MRIWGLEAREGETMPQRTLSSAGFEKDGEADVEGEVSGGEGCGDSLGIEARGSGGSNAILICRERGGAR